LQISPVFGGIEEVFASISAGRSDFPKIEEIFSSIGYWRRADGRQAIGRRFGGDLAEIRRRSGGVPTGGGRSDSDRTASSGDLAAIRRRSGLAMICGVAMAN